MNRNDKILIFIILIITAIISLSIYLPHSTNTDIIKISVNSKLYKEISINQNQIIEINENNVHCVVEIENGKVRMKESNCKDKLCVSQDFISKGNQIIVCLPNKVMLEFKSKNNKIDAISN